MEKYTDLIGRNNNELHDLALAAKGAGDEITSIAARAAIRANIAKDRIGEWLTKAANDPQGALEWQNSMNENTAKYQGERCLLAFMDANMALDLQQLEAKWTRYALRLASEYSPSEPAKARLAAYICETAYEFDLLNN